MGSAAGQHHNWGTVGGETLSGAGSGAAIGATVGGPPGALIGGAVGAIGGFLTGIFSGDSPDPIAPPEPPPPPPDVADALAQRADIAKQARLMASGTGTFVSGPLGDTSKTPGEAAKAGGY